jgi:AraC-like DNA-binding protein
MNASLNENRKGRLEPLCAGSPPARGGRIRIGAGAEGIERAQAYFCGQAFSAHRHDTYAIGVTLQGVQSFHYRGEQRHCLPGQCHILHPDETHDGGAGTDEGFAYRIVYLDPRLIQEALDGRSLPFAATPVIDASRLPRKFLVEAFDLDTAIDEVARVEIAVAAANLLLAASTGAAPAPKTLAFAAVSRVRDLIAACPAKRHSLEALERACGLDRWTLARQFRALFGTSPSRFRTQRQLDLARRLLRSGASLAMASLEAGFADQSHMSRRFKSAYGLTPAVWVAAIQER